MAQLTSQLIVSLIDRVSGPAKSVSQSLRGIGAAVNSTNATARLRTSLDQTNRSLDAMRARMAESLAVGYALKMALQAPIEAATKFETALLDIAQKAELGDAAMNALGKRMRGLAPTVNQSAMDIARALDTLLGMGLDGTTSETILPTLGKTATAYNADIADLAKTAMAAIDNLKLKAEELPRAMDMIARAGKEGAFELKDMAQYLPALAAMAEVNGMRGINAIGELGAALQITRKGAGDSAEAATNLRNVLQKLTSEQVVGKFKKLGRIDLKEQLDAQVKAGVSGLQSVWSWLNQMTGPLDASTWIAWGTAAGTAVGQVVAYLASLPGQIMALGVDITQFGTQLGMQILEGLRYCGRPDARAW